MRRILDHDPLTGVTTYFDYEQDTDKMLITEVQDVTPFLDQASSKRNDDEYSRAGIKNDWWHYARIPNVVAMDMANRFGVNMYGPSPDWKSILKIINREYPWLKMTTKTHA